MLVLALFAVIVDFCYFLSMMLYVSMLLVVKSGKVASFDARMPFLAAWQKIFSMLFFVLYVRLTWQIKFSVPLISLFSFIIIKLVFGGFYRNTLC